MVPQNAITTIGTGYKFATHQITMLYIHSVLRGFAGLQV